MPPGPVAPEEPCAGELPPELMASVEEAAEELRLFWLKPRLLAELPPKVVRPW